MQSKDKKKYVFNVCLIDTHWQSTHCKRYQLKHCLLFSETTNMSWSYKFRLRFIVSSDWLIKLIHEESDFCFDLGIKKNLNWRCVAFLLIWITWLPNPGRKFLTFWLKASSDWNTEDMIVLVRKYTSCIQMTYFFTINLKLLRCWYWWHFQCQGHLGEAKGKGQESGGQDWGMQGSTELWLGVQHSCWHFSHSLGYSWCPFWSQFPSSKIVWRQQVSYNKI